MKKAIVESIVFHIFNAIILIISFSIFVELTNEMSAYLFFGVFFINAISFVVYIILKLFIDNSNINNKFPFLLSILVVQNSIGGIFYKSIPLINFFVNMLQGDFNDSFKIGFCFNFSIVASFYCVKMIQSTFSDNDNYEEN